MREAPAQTVIWQVVVPDEAARQELERLLRERGHLTIHKGAFPEGATLGVVRSAVSLTKQEREVLRALLAHDHAGEIAEALGVCVRTVEFHLGNLTEQFGVHSRHRLLARALLSGLLPATENPGSDNP